MNLGSFTKRCECYKALYLYLYISIASYTAEAMKQGANTAHCRFTFKTFFRPWREFDSWMGNIQVA